MKEDQLPTFLTKLHLDPEIGDIFFRLRSVFHVSWPQCLTTTDLHDLTIFVLHKLLTWSPKATQTDLCPVVAASQCVRYAVAIYMLILQGPAYFSHAHLQANLVSHLRHHLDSILTLPLLHHGPLTLWMLSVGMVASHDTPEHYWFTSKAKTLVNTLHLHTWDDFVSCFGEVLWSRMQRAELLFQTRWEEAWATDAT
jgi:hypothetical protein